MRVNMYYQTLSAEPCETCDMTRLTEHTSGGAMRLMRPCIAIWISTRHSCFIQSYLGFFIDHITKRPEARHSSESGMPKQSYEMCSASMSTHFGTGVMTVHNKVFGHVRKLLQFRFALRSRGGELVRHIHCVVSKNRGAGED
jgi:hypothetical protein